MTTPRAGYDPTFLSPTRTAIPRYEGLVQLPYAHFTVLLHPRRRLAAITAVNIDGAARVELGRADDWRLDDRIPATQQAGPEIYCDNDLDRGHLVRRQDPVWGPRAVAEQANLDTFHYPVCAPQTATFNQSHQLWAGLEDYILDHASTYKQKLSVFTGCIFANDDPTYRGLAIPRRFFKIAVWSPLGNTTLAATGYVLDQTLRLDPAITSTTEVPPLGPYRTFQVPIADIATLTGLPLGALADVDRYTQVPAAADTRRAWTPLADYQDITV